jgi:hypothetical protein
VRLNDQGKILSAQVKISLADCISDNQAMRMHSRERDSSAAINFRSGSQ